MKKVTLDMIAQQVHVSKVTVFKALNNKDGVSDDLRQEIINKAKEMGYSRHNKESYNFLFAIKESFFLVASEQFYNPIYYFLSKECEKINSTINIVFLDKSGDDVLRINETIEKQGNIDGVFIAGQINTPALKNVENIKLPVVFLDFYSPLFNYNYVYLDNYHLSYSLTYKLIKSGHKKIGFVGEIGSTEAITDRYLGYKKALIENNLTCDEYHINHNIENSHIANIKITHFPDAYICHCDSAAQKLYTILALHNLSVPNDISVISFDNTPICDTLFPTLSSAGVPKDYFAKKGLQTMLDAIQTPDKKFSVSLKASFFERNSFKIKT